MAVLFVTSAVFAALLLLLSPPGAGAEIVTWRKCEAAGDFWGRILEALPDTNATMMSLDHCNLTEVRSGAFDGLPNVKKIVLYSNSIAHVDPGAFRTFLKLRWLHLNDNNLREVPVFNEHSFCPSLTTLYLSYNRITEIKHPKIFSGCKKLQYLHIDNNVIEYIHPDVFRPLSKLKKLDILSINKITTIPETLLLQNNKLNSLYLTDNKILYLASDFASKLRSAGAPLQRFYFYNNPWHCACLLELLADIKRTGVKYRHWYTSTGTQPECVYYGAYPCSRQVPTGLLGRAGRQPLALANAAF